MDRTNLNLNDLISRRERELGYPMHESMLKRDLRRDMNVAESASIQEIVGQPGTLSQDCFRALIIRQGGILERLQPLRAHAIERWERRRVNQEHRMR